MVSSPPPGGGKTSPSTPSGQSKSSKSSKSSPSAPSGKSPSIASPNRKTKRAANETALQRYQLCHDMLVHALKLPEDSPQRGSEIARYLKKLMQSEHEVPMTLEILVGTKIGRVVHKLRKSYPEAAILRDRWLKLMPENAVSQQTKDQWQKDKEKAAMAVKDANPPLLVKVPNGQPGGSDVVMIPKATPPQSGKTPSRDTPPREDRGAVPFVPMPAELMKTPSDSTDELHRKLIVATLYQAGPRAAMMQSVLEKRLELRPGTLRKPLHDAVLSGCFLFNSGTKTWELTQSYYKHLKKQTQSQMNQYYSTTPEEDRKRKNPFPDRARAADGEDPDPQLREVFLKLILAMPTSELTAVSARAMRRQAEKELQIPELSLDCRKDGIAALGIRLVDDELKRRGVQAHGG